MDTPISEIVENSKMVDLDERPQVVFVGDTHGDLEASQLVWERFEAEVDNEETYLVFLGDYVDRGRRSKENIDFLLSKKEEYPEGLVLLLGNHDAFHKKRLRPADFWQSLDDDEYEYYKDLMHLPWLAKSEGLAASHGALPFVSDLSLLEDSEDVFDRENDLDTPIWVSIAWGDLNSRISGAQTDSLTGRPQFGKEVVLKYLQKHDWNVLIRAHQPGMQGWSFSNNALTIFTSQQYVSMGRARERNVAIVNTENGVKGKENVNVISLEEL